jgi:AcrR family transcriptional regulator
MAEDPRVTRTRAAVLQAAGQLLAEEGWNAVTHVKVAERSGVGRATIYRHWPESRDLLHDVLQGVEPRPRAALTGDLRTDLLNELEMTRLTMNDGGRARAMMALVDRGQVDPDMAALSAELTTGWTAVLRAIIREGKKRGVLRKTVDPPRSAAQLLGPLVYQRFLAMKPLTRAFVEALVDDWLAANRVATT